MTRYPTTAPVYVAESPSGMRHAYTVTFGVGRTFCGRVVPKARGWFGPIDRQPECVRCISALTET